MPKIGIPKALFYYYDIELWSAFFKNLEISYIISDDSNKQILEDGENICIDEACLALKLYLGHIKNLSSKCDYILVPRLYSLKKNEQVCTNFNAVYDLVRNLYPNVKILNYDINTYKGKSELLAFINIGEKLGFSYIKSFNAYKVAKRKALEKRKEKEMKQKKKLNSNKLKILFAGHPYNLYDDLIGKSISKYLKQENIEVIYSDRINHNIISEECNKLSTDIHWTYSKEVMASINYYQDKVDGIILISSFPCGPDSLSNELINRKVNIPLITLVFEDMNSDVGVSTRLESFLDILKERRLYEKSH